MKKFIPVFFCLSIGFFACDSNSTSQQPGNEPQGISLADTQAQWLLGDWQGKDEGQSINHDFKLRMNADGTFAQEVSYQVGSDGDKEVPYETDCHFRETGTLTVATASQDIKSYFEDNQKKIIPELSITLNVQKFELIPDSSNSPACDAFIARQNRTVPSRYTTNIKKIADNEFADAWYEFNYEKK